MRKNTKIQLINICDSMIEGINNFNDNLSINVLADLQDASECIIQELHMDSLYELNVKELVQFQKICYEYSLSIEKKSKQDLKLDEQLLKIVREVKDVIENINEVLHIVFFPYNSSMWDSLESVYLEAQKDLNVEAVVVPIPYYKIKNGRKILCYEGDKFPNYIPITSYKTYSLEKIKPDIAYIHNPYDEYNKVTQIVPHFCSYNLKKHIGTLVYIPYYVTEHFNIHHLQLPVYEHVDYIIVAKNDHKKSLEQYNDTHKLLVLGSPKYDKTNKISDDYSIMPDEWNKLAKGKKIVFYNVGIIELLRYEEKVINKLESIINIAKRRDDICILFRPHPLYEATLESMKVHLLDKYLKIKQEFIENNIGIYDETPDVSIAASISSAYLGESSSVRLLFDVQGKPTFHTSINNLRMATEKDKHISYSLNACITEDKIWYIANYINKVCYIDKNTNKIVEYMNLGGNNNIYSYADIKIVDEFIAVCPSRSSKLLLIDKNKNIDVLMSDVPYLSYSKIYEYNKKLYFIPYRSDQIFVYDIYNKEKQFIDISDINHPFISSDDVRIREAICIVGSYLYLASASTNKILEINLDTNENKIYEVGSANGFLSMQYHKGCFYLNTRNESILYKWDKSENVVKVFDFLMALEKESLEYGYTMLIQGDNLLLFSIRGSKIYEFNTVNESVKESKYMSKFNFDSPVSEYYSDDFLCVIDSNGEKGIIHYRDMNLYIFDDRLDKSNDINDIQKYPLRTLSNIEADMGNNETYEIVQENYINTVDEFFDFINKDSLRNKRKKYLSKKLSDVEIGNSGKLIHNDIIQKHQEKLN